MASGKISSNAGEYISDSIRAEHYGENVYYLDGETLFNFVRHNNYVSDKTIREKLTALVHEITYNRDVFKMLQISATNTTGPVFMSCRNLVLNELLTNPLPNNILPNDDLSMLWGFVAELNKHVTPARIKYDHPTSFVTFAQRCTDHAYRLEAACMKALQELSERLDLEFEIGLSQSPGI